ncbi:MAG: LCP family protein [Patescibacteria group bacterium]|jgi:LCP family protein required for cell wall assembly
MPHLKIDFSKIKEELEAEDAPLPSRPIIHPSPSNRTGSKKIRNCLVIFLIVVVLFWGKSLLSKPAAGQPAGFWTQLAHLVTSGDKTLRGESDDRINILLLGMGGVGHDGPFLTDTIILMSFQPQEKKIALLSIPRDLVMPIPGYGWRKVNNANSYGEVAEPGQGSKLAVQTISTVLGIPIHYYLRADFAGFKEFVDQLGGLKICVEKSFSDDQYPTDDYKTQTITFSTGCQIMNGDETLKFVRSRHGDNGEGSDYARSRRQQLVLLAAKEKLLSFSTLANPIALSCLYGQFTNHIATDMEIWEMLRLFQLGKGINRDKIVTTGLTEGPGGHLETLIGEDGAFLLQPPGGDFSEIRKLVANIFSEMTPEEIAAQEKAADAAKAASKEVKKSVKENATIEIRNGTFFSGIAGNLQTYLQSLGYNVPATGNTPFRDYEKNLIYDLSGGKFPQTLNFIKEETAADVDQTIPGWLKNLSTADLVVILGQEAEKMTW